MMRFLRNRLTTNRMGIMQLLMLNPQTKSIVFGRSIQHSDKNEEKIMKNVYSSSS